MQCLHFSKVVTWAPHMVEILTCYCKVLVGCCCWEGMILKIIVLGKKFSTFKGRFGKIFVNPFWPLQSSVWIMLMRMTPMNLEMRGSECAESSYGPEATQQHLSGSALAFNIPPLIKHQVNKEHIHKTPPQNYPHPAHQKSKCVSPSDATS
jgi:hypothetical protein